MTPVKYHEAAGDEFSEIGYLELRAFAGHPQARTLEVPLLAHLRD